MHHRFYVEIKWLTKRYTTNITVKTTLPNTVIRRENHQVAVGRRTRMELNFLNPNFGIASQQLLIYVRAPKKRANYILNKVFDYIRNVNLLGQFFWLGVIVNLKKGQITGQFDASHSLRSAQNDQRTVHVGLDAFHLKYGWIRQRNFLFKKKLEQKDAVLMCAQVGFSWISSSIMSRRRT